MTDHPIFHGTLKPADDRIFDGKGRDVMTIEGGPQRLADCANALQDVWFPLAHVPATENRIERLEQLRKEAVARIPEDGRYTDTPETAPEASHGTASDAMDPSAGRVSPMARNHYEGNGSANKGGDDVTDGQTANTTDENASLAAREGEQAAAPNSEPTPTLLRLEPAGEASASPWRFDMENAPRGKNVPITRNTKDGPAEGTTFRREIIIAASKCGKVTQSYWIPDADRWCMFTKDSPPVAWMAWPSWPAESLQGVEA